MNDSQRVVDFFHDLENPDLYERIDDIPIFAKHAGKKKGSDGKWHEVKVDDRDLQEISQAYQEMEKSGSLPVITPGHRIVDQEVSEEDQPEPWGYCRNLRPGTYIGPEGNKVPTLLGTYYLSKKAISKDGKPANVAARTFPFRSVDYYAGLKKISGVALLRRDPFLDLGLVSYVSYAQENVMPPPTEPPDSRVTDEAQGGVDGAVADATGDELTPEEAGTAMRYMKHYERHHPPMKYMCDRYKAEQVGDMGAGGGVADPAVEGATDIPPGAAPKETQHPEKPPMDQNANGVAPVQYASAAQLEQYAREQAAMKQTIARLEKSKAESDKLLGEERRARRLTQYGSELARLKDVERYEFDEKEELEICENYTPEQFQKHIGRLRKICKQDPTGASLMSPDQYAGRGWEGSNGGQRPDDGMLDPETLSQVYMYIREHPADGSNWDKCVKAVIAQRTTGAAK